MLKEKHFYVVAVGGKNCCVPARQVHSVCVWIVFDAAGLLECLICSADESGLLAFPPPRATADISH